MAYDTRLLEYAANYFDLSMLPDGNMKRALQKVVDKKRKGRNGHVNRQLHRCFYSPIVFLDLP
jgi:hypothetical protein